MKSSAIPAADAAKKPRAFSARRLVLLTTTIASLGAAALVVAPGLNLTGGYPAALAQNLSEQAHKLQAPVGFADIVEKVKPAVISVRVKVDGGSETTGLTAATKFPRACANSSAASECPMVRMGRKECLAAVAVM